MYTYNMLVYSVQYIKCPFTDYEHELKMYVYMLMYTFVFMIIDHG